MQKIEVGDMVRYSGWNAEYIVVKKGWFFYKLWFPNRWSGHWAWAPDSYSWDLKYNLELVEDSRPIHESFTIGDFVSFNNIGAYKIVDKFYKFYKIEGGTNWISEYELQRAEIPRRVHHRTYPLPRYPRDFHPTYPVIVKTAFKNYDWVKEGF